MSVERVITSLIAVVLVTLSSSLHEFGHAYAAYHCGDPTAKEQGRLTVNPLAHIDPFGSVLLPLLLIFTSGSYIAFAKPVPYDPRRLRNPRRDEVIVAFAGPLANIFQATIGALCVRGLLWWLEGADAATIMAVSSHEGPIWWLLYVLQVYVYINCSLAFFNLLPLPPLDGSAIISPLLSGKARVAYYQVQRYALPITLAVIWLLPRFTGIDPVGWWLSMTAGNLASFLLGW